MSIENFNSAPDEQSQDDIEKYNTEPLPFEHVDGVEHVLTWKDFDQDETGECVYLYRSIQYIDKDSASSTAHQSHAASFGESPEDVFKRLNETDKKRIAKIATEFFQGNSPILHTTRDKNFAERVVGDQGVMISYKIPKAWLLKDENKPYLGNVGESELDFFHQIPKEFVSDILQKGEPDVIHYEPKPKDDNVNDVISLDDLKEPPNNS
jgi:hypothetical protein